MKYFLICALISAALATNAKAVSPIDELTGKTFVHTLYHPGQKREFHWWVTFPANGDRLAEVSDDFWGGTTPDCDLRWSHSPCIERHFFFDLDGQTIELFGRADGTKLRSTYRLAADGESLIDGDGLVYTLKP